MTEYRGLSEICFQMIETIPGLQELMDHVCHSDPECSVEIRHDYLNCYYHGGSMFKLTFNTLGKTLTFTFDPKYFNLQAAPQADFAELENWVKGRSRDPRQWLERLDGLKRVMDAWFREHPKEERGVQQELAAHGTFAQGAYQVIDIELAIPRHPELGRMDLAAVRREGDRYVPVIVELKHGTKAFSNSSGLREHYAKTTAFLNGPEGGPYLVETIRRVWDSKRRLGLISEPVPDAGAFGETELMFAVTGWENGTAEKIRERLPDTLERNVWAVISSGRELDFGGGTLFPKTV
ncbi:MAG: hypothetical protein K2K53_12445 [Oscillospiraceae bacterium]|nr:hypothetical protein [Oscillospiraceae bacterium]